MKYTEKIEAAEKQLRSEKEKVEEIQQRIKSENDRKQTLSKEIAILESRALEYDSQILQVKKENSATKDSNLALETSENARLAALLKEYEEKIRTAIEEKQASIREKKLEVDKAYSEASKLEIEITDRHNQNVKINQHYRNEIIKMEDIIERKKDELYEKEKSRFQLEQEKLQKEALLKNIQSSQAVLLEQEQQLNNKVGELTASLKSKNNELDENIKHLEENSVKYSDINKEKIAKEEELKQLIITFKQQEDSSTAEILPLKSTLNEIMTQHTQLQNLLNLKQQEIKNLHEDLSTWQEVTKQINMDNIKLKEAIEQLEIQNKKLLELMNAHLFSRASYYKERTLRLLQASSWNTGKYLPSQPEREIGSPERLAKLLEEEKKTTAKGVSEVAAMTHFKTQSIDLLKQFDKIKTPIKSTITQNTFSTPIEMPNIRSPPQNPSGVNEQIIKSTQELLKLLGGPVPRKTPATATKFRSRIESCRPSLPSSEKNTRLTS